MKSNMLLDLKLFSTSGTKDDNFVFQLLYRWTVTILVVLSSIITFKLWLGDSFTCMLRTDTGLVAKFLDCHCYATGTFVIRSSWNKEAPGANIPYPGIENYSPGEIRSYLTYYGWVNLLLLLHAFNFCLPRLIWKVYERGFLKKLVMGIDEFSADEDNRQMSLDVLAKYMVQSHGTHFIYPTIYIFCEILNHIIAICQTVWLVYFFGVTGVPKEAPEVNFETWGDFATYYFPLMSKCTLRMFGVSGAVQRRDVMCSLPLNNGYWFLFLFLFAWYNFLAVLTGLNLVYRLSLYIPRLRLQVLKLKAPLTHVSYLHSLCGRSSYFDWFILSRVQMNLRQDNFADLIAKIVTLSQDSEKTDVFEVSEKSR